MNIRGRRRQLIGRRCPRARSGWNLSRAAGIFFGRRPEGKRGVAAAELALLTPLLSYFFVGAFDYGMAGYRKLQVQNAAQAGALFAIEHGFDSTSIANVVVNATTYSGIAASPAPAQYCGCPSAIGIKAQSCGVTCVDGSSPATYVAVSSSAAYQTALSYPLLPSNFALSSVATVRIK